MVEKNITLQNQENDLVQILPSANGQTLKIVVLVSGAGTNMKAILEASKHEDYNVEIVAVGADREGTKGIAIAEESNIPTFTHVLKEYDNRSKWNEALKESVKQFNPDLVVCAGFLKLLDQDFLEEFPQRVINTHNALLPSFPGVHGPADALEYGVKITGATLFIVDPGIDTGSILSQVTCPVKDDDTVDTLLERIKVVERKQLVESIGKMAKEGWWQKGRKAGIGQLEK